MAESADDDSGDDAEGSEADPDDATDGSVSDADADGDAGRPDDGVSESEGEGGKSGEGVSESDGDGGKSDGEIDGSDGGSESDGDLEKPDRETEEPGDDGDESGETGEHESGNGEAFEEPELVETGPESDEELPLTAHIEEMIRRLAVVVTVAAVVTVLAFPLGEEAINFLWYSILPGTDVAKPHLYNPLELVFTQLKVASLAGLVAALPVAVYQTYLFMRPGLYPHERRYYLAAVPMSLLLAFVGITFAYFVVLPAVFTYFYSYSQEVARIAFSLGQTFNLILVLMGYLAIVFQIPLFVMLAIMMGITTREWLATRRLLFWSGFVGAAFLLSPDPTGVSPIIIGVTMILLFEGSLLVAKWAGA